MAEDHYDSVVEVAEIKGGKIAAVRVIDGKYLTDTPSIASLPGLPFDLEFSGSCVTRGWFRRKPPGRAAAFWWLMDIPARMADEKQAESNQPACYARVLRADDGKGNPFILSSGALQPFTVCEGGRMFAISMGKRQWVLPFAVRLDRFTAEFHPGTMKPKAFTSVIHRIEDGREAGVTIRMNEPMRYKGYTFFQASYGPAGTTSGEPVYSVFSGRAQSGGQVAGMELDVVSFGLLTHFLIKLAGYVRRMKRNTMS